MDTKNRYRFYNCGFVKDVLWVTFFDTELNVYTSKAVNINDLDFLGGHDDPSGAQEDAVRERSE